MSCANTGCRLLTKQIVRNPIRRSSNEQVVETPSKLVPDYHSVVVRAYTIEAWFEAGATMSTREAANPDSVYEFVGQLIHEHDYLGRRLTENGADLTATQIGFTYLPRR